jgi:hypothetical protein
MAAVQLRLPLGDGDAMTGIERSGSTALSAVGQQRDIALIDLIDRLLDGGVVLAGDITLAVADVDLVYVGLRALISSVAAAEREGVALPR